MILGHNCYKSRVITDFVLKFSKFRYHGNKDLSFSNFYKVINY